MVACEDLVVGILEPRQVLPQARLQSGELLKRTARPLVQGTELVDDAVVVLGVRVVVRHLL